MRKSGRDWFRMVIDNGCWLVHWLMRDVGGGGWDPIDHDDNNISPRSINHFLLLPPLWLSNVFKVSSSWFRFHKKLDDNLWFLLYLALTKTIFQDIKKPKIFSIGKWKQCVIVFKILYFWMGRGSHQILNIFGKNLAVKIDIVILNISNIWRLQFSNESMGVELRISEI